MTLLTPKQRRLRADARAAFGTPEGKRILHWMMRRFHVLGGCFDPEPTQHAFFEGERNAVLEVIELTAISPAELEEAYREARLRDREPQEDTE